MNANRKLFVVLLQVVLWSAFIALPYFMVPHQSEQTTIEEFLKRYSPQPDLPLNILLGTLVFNFFLIAFFYINHYLLFDKFVVTRKYGRYLAIISAAFVIIFCVSVVYKRMFFSTVPAVIKPITFREIVRDLTWYLLLLLISLGLKFLAQWQQAEKRASEIENEHLRTELSFLHAQINPHFLFNSLNTIYSLALKKSDAAPVAIMKLSNLLRYVVDEATMYNVPLEQEVNYLNNYIELQKLRSTSTLNVHFKVEGDISSSTIAPMLLLPFVENAFKYGISNHEASPIDISVIRQNGHIEFGVKNKKFIQTEQHSTGIGIANVQRRLELLYHGKHELHIDDNSETYSINLTLHPYD